MFHNPFAPRSETQANSESARQPPPKMDTQVLPAPSESSNKVMHHCKTLKRLLEVLPLPNPPRDQILEILKANVQLLTAFIELERQQQQQQSQVNDIPSNQQQRNNIVNESRLLSGASQVQEASSSQLQSQVDERDIPTPPPAPPWHKPQLLPLPPWQQPQQSQVSDTPVIRESQSPQPVTNQQDIVGPNVASQADHDTTLNNTVPILETERKKKAPAKRPENIVRQTTNLVMSSTASDGNMALQLQFMSMPMMVPQNHHNHHRFIHPYHHAHLNYYHRRFHQSQVNSAPYPGIEGPQPPLGVGEYLQPPGVEELLQPPGVEEPHVSPLLSKKARKRARRRAKKENNVVELGANNNCAVANVQ